eukprot:m.135552 g.135552  ORF g.135552 m.135552 type:complete len:646 (+) comp11419_c0_seq3:259-2196(+)
MSELVGVNCVIGGLVGRPELNGLSTCPESFNEANGRLRCPVTSSDGYTEFVAIKPANLTPNPSGPAAAAAGAAADAEEFEHVNSEEAADMPPPTDTASPVTPPQHGDEEEEYDPDMPQLFSLRKPKDARAGAASAAKSLAKGVVGGVAALFVAPVVGAREGGVRGFVKGVGAGVISAVALPVAGACVGAVQLGRGIANTPHSVMERARGHFWDERKRKWVDYDPKLQIEAEAVNERSDDAGDGPKETGLYELLEVEPTATADEIKKSYYKLARSAHPDRNPDDPSANERFQKLSQAYQVLSDPKARQQYDLRGEESVSGGGMMDGAIFFTMLFGSDRFNGLVGELYCATSVRLSGTAGSERALERAQMARVAKLAEKLVERLVVYELGNKDEFKSTAEKEALELSTASFGGVILESVGSAYESAAIEAMGGLQGMRESVRSWGRSFGRYYTAAKSVANVMSMQNKMEKRMKMREKEKLKAEKKAGQASSDAEGNDASGGAARATADGESDYVPPFADASGEDEDVEAAAAAQAAADMAEDMEMQKEALPTILRALWSANAIDIAKTLKVVCKAVLYGGHGIDPVLKETRATRAQGLLLLGRTFRVAGAAAADSFDADAFQDTMFNAAQADAERRSKEEEEGHAGE